MITNRLSVLLAEKQMKNNTLAKKANISENTISSISQNKVRMIQIETLDKICKVLEIAPSDFFDFVPLFIDYNFDIFEKEEEEGGEVFSIPYAKLTLNVSKYNTLIGSIYYKSKDEFSLDVEQKDGKQSETGYVFIDFILDSDENNILSEIKKLSIPIQAKIKDDINHHVQREIDSVLKKIYPTLKEKKIDIETIISTKLF